MALPKARFTTTESFQGNQGEVCSVCKNRVPVVYFADGVGKVCADCDPKKSRGHLIEVVEDAVPDAE